MLAIATGAREALLISVVKDKHFKMHKQKRNRKKAQHEQTLTTLNHVTVINRAVRSSVKHSRRDLRYHKLNH